MKETIKKILIHILFLIFGFILASCSIDRLVTQDLAICGNLGAKSTEITEIQGNVPSGNIFSSLRTMFLFDVTAGWNRLYSYYDSNSLEYTYEGVRPINVNEYVDFSSGTRQYAFDVSFDTFVLVNNQRGFSVLFGALGDLMTIQAVQLGQDDQNTVQAIYTYGEVSDYNYLLYFNYNGFYETKFIRIYFSANFGNNPIYNEFFKLYMYGLYSSIGGYPQGYDDGYNIGYQEGYDDAIIENEEAYNNGYNAGYDQAISESISNPEHLFYSVWAILSLFGDLAFTFFNTKLWGDITFGFILIVLPFGFGLLTRIINWIVGLGGKNDE